MPSSFKILDMCHICQYTTHCIYKPTHRCLAMMEAAILHRIRLAVSELSLLSLRGICNCQTTQRHQTAVAAELTTTFDFTLVFPSRLKERATAAVHRVVK